MPRLLAVALSGALLVLLAAAASCTEETVVLATIPDTDAGAPSAPLRCTDTCPAGYYCSKTSCGEAAGTCQLPPVVCDPTPPVCGCDGVTYFNDCLRQANGVASSTAGECPPTSTSLCGGAMDVPCPPGALCAQLGGLPHGPCPPNIPGTCWVLPATCPTPTETDRWDSCGPAATPCLDTCTAIRTGGAYRRSQTCQ